MIAPTRQWLWNRLLAWWLASCLRDFPWRHTDDPFQVLVAEMLLQRTRADAVSIVWPSITRRWPDAVSLSSASDKELSAATASLGLAWRSRNLKLMATALVDDHDGRVPEDEEALLALPGVGPYAATATRVMAFDVHDLVSDANVVRVFSRLLGLDVDSETRRRQWFVDRIRPFRPVHESRRSNLALLDFAAVVCTVRQPRCHDCPLRSRCQFGSLKGRT